jgi:hypothetical protein
VVVEDDLCGFAIAVQHWLKPSRSCGLSQSIPREVSVEQAGGILLVAVEEVAVAVERERDGRVTHAGAERLEGVSADALCVWHRDDGPRRCAVRLDARGVPRRPRCAS